MLTTRQAVGGRTTWQREQPGIVASALQRRWSWGGGQLGRPRAGLPAWQSSGSHAGARVCRQLLCDQSKGQIVEGSSSSKESGVWAVLVWLGPARKSLLSSVPRHQIAPKQGPVGRLMSERQAAPSPFIDGALNTSFGAHHMACGILGPRPGIKPVSPALEAQNLNHWTISEVLKDFFFFLTELICVLESHLWPKVTERLERKGSGLLTVSCRGPQQELTRLKPAKKRDV